VTPDVHADDLHRLIQAIGGEPVDLFASSGGAVNALALMSKHPEDVRTLVAHEPPLASILPDREHAMAATSAVTETYRRSGWGAGMAQFIAISSHQGLLSAEIAGQPAPDPAMFGMPAEDDGSRTDPLLGQNLVTCTHYDPTSTPWGPHRHRSSWPPARSPRARWRTVAPSPSPSGLAPNR
jgi:pimeloyl-ACP methyl ester carboxylesterase